MPALEGECIMEDVQTAKAPVHLWIVGLLSLLWNGFGCYDYLMTRMRNEDYFRSMAPDSDPQAMLAWVDGFPIYAQIGWGLGVWMGLLGSILLLMRNRWSVPAYGISLIGAIIGLGYQMMNPPNWPGMGSGMSAIMPIVIIVVAIGLFLYARAMSNRGVLK